MSIFTDEEYKHLMLLACGEQGATEEQVFSFIKQCEEMKFQATPVGCKVALRFLAVTNTWCR